MNAWLCGGVAGWLLAAGIAGSAVAQDGADQDRGQALYENHCRFCHESWAHERQTRQVTTRAELRRRVMGWALHSGLEWGDEEVDAVTAYLDRRFYDLTE